MAILRDCAAACLPCSSMQQSTKLRTVWLSRRTIAGSDYTGSGVAKACRVLFAQTSDARCSSGGYYRDRVAEPGLKLLYDGCLDTRVVYRVAKSATRPYNNTA